MTAFLIALAITDLTWSSETGMHLIEITDGEGVGIVRDTSEVAILDAKGRVSTTVKTSQGQVAVHYSVTDGLYEAPRSMLSFNKSKEPVHGSQLYNVFTQHGHIMRTGLGVVAATRKGLFTQSYFDSSTAIGVNRMGDCIAMFETTSGLGLLKLFNLVQGQWVRERTERLPWVKDVGPVLPAVGFSDLVFISDKVICFIGDLHGMSVATEPLPSQWGSRLLSSSVLSFTTFPRTAVSYLFAYDVETGETRPLLKVSRATGDLHPFITGRVVGSFDDRFLYLRGVSGVARIKVSAILSNIDDGSQ